MTLWNLAKSVVGQVHLTAGMGYFRERDLANAALSFRKAIDAGNKTRAPECLMRVGMAYDTGDGVAKDEAQAVQCYMHAALAGYQPAILAMGLKARHGCAAGQSRDTARKCFRTLLEAAEDDNLMAEAYRNLQEMDEEDEQEATERERQQRWQQGQQQGRGGGGTGTMSRAQALEILDLGEGATQPDMKRAWMRLMQQNHPDKGGSTYFAKKLNEVREILGF